MDPVTQIALGATIAEAGFRKRLGGKAVIFGGICGLLPDMDIVIRIAGQWEYFKHHRGLSHSLFFLAIVAPAIAWFGYLWSKKNHYLSWLHLTLWALLTHPILDLFTSYGTQIWAPVTSRKFALDAIAIIDLFYTIPLILALFVGSFSRWSLQFRQRFARIVLILTSGYILLGYIQNQKAISVAKRELQKYNFSITEIRATPSLLNIFLWRVIARNEKGELRIAMVSTWNTVRPLCFYSFQEERNIWVEKALQSKQGQIFHHFSMKLFSTETQYHEKGVSVYLKDQRYGLVSDPARNIFTVCAEFDSQGNLIEIRMVQSIKMDIRKELNVMWHLLMGC